MKHIKGLGLGLGVVISGIILVALISGFGNKEAEVVPSIKNVTTVTASEATLTTEVEYASILKPVQEVTVSSKIAGRVATVQVEAGDRVEKGQVLFTLDSGDLQAQLQQQQANLEVSEANLAKTAGSAYDQQVLQAEQTVQNKQITYEDAKKKYDLNQQLYASGVIAKLTLDDFQKQYASAEVDLKTAQDNLKLLKEKSGPDSVSVASAQVKQAAAGVNYASEQLKNTVITAPISGVVSGRNVDEGEIISGSTAALTIIDTDTMMAEISVPDKVVAKIEKGEIISLKMNALGNKLVEGVVDYISPNADSKSKAYTIKILLNTTDDLKSGMFARVILPEAVKENVLTVPNEAIKIENSGSVVYLVAEGSVKKVQVTTGLANDRFTEIIDGLKAGDEVITEGQIFLNEGEKVNVVSGQ
ncbi:efflux RND transporter periplasmic adaptor subunit [Desulfosporosinus meridiei]|uniref:RND family efflux transporter, MFP subunit n=1 Tax=Desulfosporosinus meridiei (strain ATCC BAA-275 / DSM 13257 / KCTC 12902 / NCIMB 13706 / S10) TaxID=768704 RepID=J7IT98_DESMD|nr:efflux RND transporter periplasmic adaptor subunit [Desulfosporosinus meridiei]AFQ43389.1 RND family efflux transporter, MFP subunit [Desulfosporosinus meridiei DSM 13257]